MASPAIEEQLKTLPTKPGVYLFRDASDQVIYVGKAVNLRNRVRSYFGSLAGQPQKTRELAQRVHGLELVVTDSELEALLAECNLIKQHRPRYNVRLKDDKHYPYLKVTVNEEWPRVYMTRRQEKDGARYFGPYTNSSSVVRALDLLNKLFPYRTCLKPITGNDSRPCLEYFIHRCLGPCIGAVSKDEYRAAVERVCLFLEGKDESIVRELRARMEEAAERQEFERAAYLRDQMFAVQKVSERQKIINTEQTDQDVIAFARNDGEACAQVFFIRNGRLIGREHFVLEGTQDEETPEVLASFVKQFYDLATFVPPEILLPEQIEGMQIVERWLADKRGGRVAIRAPQRGDKRKLVEMVEENARIALEQLRAQWLADRNKTALAVEELQDALGLPTLPDRIECYDIANVRGVSAVGSMVVFQSGEARKEHYRRFQIKTVEGANDFAMLQEVLRRRFKRFAARPGETHEDAGARALPLDPWHAAPDLVIVDGGKGQLTAATVVMQELGLEFLPTVALAKEHEEIFLPGRPDAVVLPRNSQALYLLQRIRDEAHRFANTYHGQVHRRSSLRSSLDDVPGIGPSRKRTLLRHFGSVRRMREASIDDLAAVPGMTRALALKVKEAVG